MDLFLKKITVPASSKWSVLVWMNENGEQRRSSSVVPTGHQYLTRRVLSPNPDSDQCLETCILDQQWFRRTGCRGIIPVGAQKFLTYRHSANTVFIGCRLYLLTNEFSACRPVSEREMIRLRNQSLNCFWMPYWWQFKSTNFSQGVENFIFI